jgi:hemoglobin
MLAVLMAAASGCGEPEKKDRGFFTSGSRDADQRAEQRVARDEQIKGKSEGGHGSGGGAGATTKEAKTLYDRLGGDKGIAALVDDFVTRSLADPRVNWERKGVTRGGLSIHRNESVEWKASDDQIKALKAHLAQFLAVATGGPTKYEGKEMAEAHKGLHISNAEFDASVGDLKASLDKLGIAVQEQKELLAIIESTRPQVAEER